MMDSSFWQNDSCCFDFVHTCLFRNNFLIMSLMGTEALMFTWDTHPHMCTQDLVELVRMTLEERHSHRLEWGIIWLIVIEVLFELLHYVKEFST
eukprot:m.690920 g.690920  ORF g.690920 m.690920 type:complete len:94 (-) comp22852_c0_seq33:1854-2135(-)